MRRQFYRLQSDHSSMEASYTAESFMNKALLVPQQQIHITALKKFKLRSKTKNTKPNKLIKRFVKTVLSSILKGITDHFNKIYYPIPKRKDI